MLQITDASHIKDVLRHGQVYYGVDTTTKSKEKAKLGRFLDKYGNLTSNGRNLALMMLSEKSKYLEFFGSHLRIVDIHKSHSSVFGI